MNEKAFWSKVDKSGDCWLWKGPTRRGYGVYWESGSRKAAHRVSFELHNGPIDSDDDTYHGNCVLHSCDTPGCVNPSHLRLGSHAENMQDMIDRGRHGRRGGSGHGNGGGEAAQVFGTRNGSAKITEADIPLIRGLGEFGHTHASIASRFGVSRTQISKILRGEYWAQVA